jgi:hypothetical protein
MMIVAPSNRSKNLRGAVSLIHENQMKLQSQKEQICPKIGRNRNSRRSKFVRKSDEIAKGTNFSENRSKTQPHKEQICPKIGRNRNRSVDGIGVADASGNGAMEFLGLASDSRLEAKKKQKIGILIESQTRVPKTD